MKKILLIILAFTLGILGITNTNGIEITLPTNNLPLLDEGENTIQGSGNLKICPNNTEYNSCQGNELNTFITGSTVITAPKMYINCKNGFISKIKSSYGVTIQGFISNSNSVKLVYNGQVITLTCKPVTQPTKIIEKETLDINYQTIQTPKNNPFDTLVLSTPNNPEINSNKLEKLEPGKEPDSQPTFTDILFLQLKTISNLSDSILESKPSISFSSLFENTTNTGFNFTGYNIWLNKFTNYSTKEEFEDAFSGAITLKDIGIANDIIKGLYICLLNNNCSNVINFKHSITDKFDTYTFKEIENDLYSGSDNILDASINYYSNLKNTCSNTDVGDTFLNTQISSICSKLLSNQVDANNLENYDLGYSLGVRINNLQRIKDGIDPSKGINLKGIFNIYWELNNLTLGTNKLTKVKEVIEEPSLTGKYEIFKEILKTDLTEIENKKIDDNEYKQILETNVNILSPNNPILETIKEENPTLDLTDKNSFQIINTENGGNIILPIGVNINLFNISSLKDLAKIPEYSDKVKIIFKESNGTYRNSLGFYEEDNGKPTKGEIKIKDTSSYEKGKEIYEGELKNGLFIVSNENINETNIQFNKCLIPGGTNAGGIKGFIATISSKILPINPCNNSKYKIGNGGNTIFFDNPSYNYDNKQQFKIKIFSGYALVGIEDIYNGNYDYNDIILKVIPKKDD